MSAAVQYDAHGDFTLLHDSLAVGLLITLMAAAAARQPKAELKGVADGVDMVLAQMKSALANHGLKEINPSGQAFDPHQHQAISHQPSSEVKEEHVLQVVRVGYSLNGRLLRPASVIISSGPAKPAAVV